LKWVNFNLENTTVGGWPFRGCGGKWLRESKLYSKGEMENGIKETTLKIPSHVICGV
jgi:hypothetical protein